VAVAIQGQLEQGTETAQAREDAGPGGARRGRPDPLDQAVTRVDIDAGMR
jgi:hypothetical protein